MKKSGTRKQGDIDPSFGKDGVFEVNLDGYFSVEPGEFDTGRSLGQVHDENMMFAVGVIEMEEKLAQGLWHYVLARVWNMTLALGVTKKRAKPAAGSWRYALARATPAGTFDTTFGQGDEHGNVGVVIGGLGSDLGMSGAQAWPTPDRATVVLLRNMASRSWTLARHDIAGTQDKTFGTFGYVDVDAIRPFGEPFVVKGFVISGPGHDFFFIGTTRKATEGKDQLAGGIVMRFTANGQLSPQFGAGRGYALVDVPLNPAGRITDAVLQDDGKIVLSTATSGGNGRIVRLLPTGKPDPDFGTDGTFVVEGDNADVNEIEKLAWSKEAGLWGVGTVMNRSPKKVGLLVALDDRGTIPASFNGGKLLEIGYADEGVARPLYLKTEAGGGVTVIASPYWNGGSETRMKAVVGRHLASGQLDPSFGTSEGFYEIDLTRNALNFNFLGIDVTEDRVTLEIFSGGASVSNPDRITVERFLAT